MFSSFPITKKRKGDIFMESTGTFTYYEDLYGRRNDEEFDEGPMRSCESDDGDEAVEKPSQMLSAPSQSLRQFATPKGKSMQVGFGSLGAVKAPGKKRFLAAPASDIEDITTASPTNTNKGTPATSSYQMLMPRTFGMFGAPTTAAEPQAPNSAGEALDDILGADALNSNEDDFQTLEPEKEAAEILQ